MPATDIEHKAIPPYKRSASLSKKLFMLFPDFIKSSSSDSSFSSEDVDVFKKISLKFMALAELVFKGKTPENPQIKVSAVII